VNICMLNLTTRMVIAPVLCLAAASLQASTGSIGFATASGSFQVDSSKISGSTTIFNGTEITTGAAPSRIKLNNGAEVRLAAGSRAKLYETVLVLEEGNAQLESSGAAYQVQANNLRISNAAPNAFARVGLDKANYVTVAAVRGSVQVLNTGGTLFAQVKAGRSQAFPSEVGAAGPAKIAGCLSLKNGEVILTETATNIRTEVRGAGVEKEVGNSVQLIGLPVAVSSGVEGVSEVLNASSVVRTARGCSAKVAGKVGLAGAGAAAGAAGATAAGAGAAVGVGAISATTLAVAGTVVAVTGTAAASAGGAFSGGSFSSTSR
jgi:hypothetical protein